MEENQRIEVDTRLIELVLSNGERIAGELFLQLQGVHSAGPQRVGEVLNGEENFLPVRGAERVELVNLEQVVSVTVDAEAEFDPLLALGAEYRIRVSPAAGAPLDVRIHVNLPGEHNRVKDFLNQRKRFLLLLHADKVVYMARNWILRVED